MFYYRRAKIVLHLACEETVREKMDEKAGAYLVHRGLINDLIS